jgi:tetratricopeptide (TPR) repeat protein
MKEAHERCEVATHADMPATALTLEAQMALARGDLAAAVSHLNRALEISDRYSERLYFRGLAELANHQADDAQRDFRHALDDDPSLTVAQLALDGKITAPAQGLEAFRAHSRHLLAEKLASGGHLLLDVNLPERAQACFAAADRLAIGPAQAMRIAHRAEKDLPGALRESEALAATKSDPYLMSLRAWLLLDVGRPGEARAWLDRVLEVQPRDRKAQQLYVDVCEAEDDLGCVVKHRQLLEKH